MERMVTGRVGGMKSSLDITRLLKLVRQQVHNIMPDGIPVSIDREDVMHAMKRLEYCISHIHRKYFFSNGKPVFDHLHGDQYSMFLYLLSNVLYKFGKEPEAAKVFLLNKQMFGIDAFYSIELPDIFYFCHPLGTVLGSASYSDYLVIYQGVTIGSDLGEDGKAGVYPKIGKGCALLANSTVIGGCNVGNNVIFGAASFLRKRDVNDDSVILGLYPNNVMKKNKYINVEYYFGRPMPMTCREQNDVFL